MPLNLILALPLPMLLQLAPALPLPMHLPLPMEMDPVFTTFFRSARAAFIGSYCSEQDILRGHNPGQIVSTKGLSLGSVVASLVQCGADKSFKSLLDLVIQQFIDRFWIS